MKTFSLTAALLFFAGTVFCQQKKADTSRNQNNARPQSASKTNPFITHTGKTIRNIVIRNVGFEGDIHDTTKVNGGFGVKLGNALHTNTKTKVIQNNLLFKEGDKVNPYLLADNERHLRDLDFIQDALIIVQKVNNNQDVVDLIVLVKDGFSLLPGTGLGGLQKYYPELKEENIAGTGAKIAVNFLWDHIRNPKFGLGAEFTQRNVGGSFINWSLGFKSYNNAFNSNRNEENTYYARIEKPLASQYLQWMGAIDVSYNKTSNAYVADSTYKKLWRYSFYNIDGWVAYNFDAKKLRHKNLKSPLRKFLALRAFHKNFNDIPDDYTNDYDGTYSNSSGLLGSFSVFKQNYFRTTYLYGFGRNEDVPQGFSASLIGGYTIKKDSLYKDFRTRPYFGLEAMSGKYNKKDFYSSYTARIGGYRYKDHWEDFEVLFNADHFTRLKQINSRWYKRFFLSGGFTKRFSPLLGESLKLRSPFGLPYFDVTNLDANFHFPDVDFRATVKTEAVFYHTKKAWGFGFAPFGFADVCLLKPTGLGLGKSDLYSALGTGFRIRNENLLFGTIEARFSYYPRTLPGMGHFKIKFDTQLRYKYKSSFIRRPDFVSPNL